MDTITSSDTIKHTTVLTPHGERLPAFFVLWGFEEDEYDVKVTLSYADCEITSAADDFLTALNTIRADLEKTGHLVLCYGASENVHVSGMSLSMAEGILANKLTIGQYAAHKDTVNIFDTGDDVIPSTFLQQERFYRIWSKSLTG